MGSLSREMTFKKSASAYNVETLSVPTYASLFYSIATSTAVAPTWLSMLLPLMRIYILRLLAYIRSYVAQSVCSSSMTVGPFHQVATTKVATSSWSWRVADSLPHDFCSHYRRELVCGVAVRDLAKEQNNLRARVDRGRRNLGGSF